MKIKITKKIKIIMNIKITMNIKTNKQKKENAEIKMKKMNKMKELLPLTLLVKHLMMKNGQKNHSTIKTASCAFRGHEKTNNVHKIKKKIKSKHVKRCCKP